MASVSMASHTPLGPLQQAKETIDECLPSDQPNYELSSGDLDNKLHEAFSALVDFIHANPCLELSCEEKGDVWHILLKLWNWCADDQKSSTEAPRCLAAIRQHTSDLLEALDDDELSSKERSTKLAIYHKMGAAHAKAGEQEAAEAAYGKAQELCVCVTADLKSLGVPEPQRIDIMTSCLALILDRLADAWKLHQTALTSELLSRASDLLQQAALPSQQRFHMRRQDALSSLEKGKASQNTRGINAESLLAYSQQLVTGHLDKEDDGSENCQKEVASLQAKVLRVLSQAYLLSGQPAHALACVQSVRKLQHPLEDARGLCLTAIGALTQLERQEEADEELLELVLDKGASADQCLAGLSAVVRAPSCSVPKSAVQYILERFSEDAAVCLRVYKVLLGTPDGEKNISREREAAVIKMVRYKNIPQVFWKEDGSTKDERKSLCMLLWNHAIQLYNSREYRASANFYFAAMKFTERSSATYAALDRECERIYQAKPELFRCSPESFDIGDEIIPSSEPQIVDAKARKALDRLLPLMKSEDPSLNFREAMVKELLVICNNAAAKQVLSRLWDEALAVQGPCKRPGEDAVIVINLIGITAGMEKGYNLETQYLKSIPAAEEYQCSEPHGNNGADSNQTSVHQELAKLFDQALHRMEAVGEDNFCGGKASAPPWFAGASYYAAVAAMDAKDPIAAAVLFRACGSFHEALSFTTPEYWKIRRETYMLGIKCTMDEYASHPGRKSCLTEADALHKKACAALKAAVQLPVDPKDLMAFRKALWNVELDLAMKKGRYALMAPLVERAKTEGLFTAEELLHICRLCLEIPDIPHPPSATVAFRAALQHMRLQTESPPYMNKLAETVTELYKVSSDEEALTLLADVGTYVRSMETPAYPSSEMSWLITTAWDTGRKHAQHGDHAKALAFLAAAIELTDLCDALKEKKEEFKSFFEFEVVQAAQKASQ